MRKARTWFSKNFRASTLDELQKLCPAGSEENASFRMVVSYWEMVASFVTCGILHRELVMLNCSELRLVWERVSRIAPSVRQTFDNQNLFRNLESVASAMDDYRLPDAAFGV
jgi:hypothetical protein